jgi:endoglucanase
MVSHISEDGFLRFANLGGLYRQTLRGARVRFAGGHVGIIYSEPLTNPNEVPPLDKHFIDVGATSRDDSPVPVGAAATFWRPFLAQGTRLTAKAMDDRIGCAIAVETLRRLEDSPHDVYCVFTAQEEVGTRGAMAAANRIRPTVGVAIDVTKTGDLPKAQPMAVKLGAGPAIKVRDSGMIAHPGLVKVMRQRAEAAGIPYQLEVLTGGSTDARSMQIAGPGCAAGCVSIPCRYVHSQSETVDSRDVEGAVALLVEMLANPIDL